MLKTTLTPCLLLSAAMAWAPTATAQNQGGRAQQPPQAPPAHAPQQPRQHPGPGQAQPAETRAQVEARERAAERARLRAQDAAAQQRWQNAMQSTVRNEHTHRLQVARIERMQQIYRDQKRFDRVEQLTQLRERLDARYQDRMRDCRLTLGEEDFVRLRDRIAEHDQLHLQDQDRDRTRDQVSTPSR